jgi:hypothetical protein
MTPFYAFYALIELEKKQLSTLSATIADRLCVPMLTSLRDITIDQLTTIANRPNVIKIRLDAVYSMALNEVRNAVGLSDALATSTTTPVAEKGTGVRVAIIDTGVDHTHPDLQHIHPTHCRSFINGVESSDINDGHGHGTLMAGIICGKGTSIPGEVVLSSSSSRA